MKLFSKKDELIKDFRSWEQNISENHKGDGKSALSLGDFILRKDGLKHFENVVEQVLNDEIVIKKATSEFFVKFDEYNNGRHHDLGIKAEIKETKGSVFVGVEAKVNEPFGSKYVHKEYLDAIKRRLDGSGTKMPNRIEKLLKQHYGTSDIYEVDDVRYQLLFSTVGTLAAKKKDDQPYDISIFYVVVFETPKYVKEDGERNYNDFQDFLKSIDAKKCPSVGENNAEVYKATIDGKELILIYETIEFKD